MEKQYLKQIDPKELAIFKGTPNDSINDYYVIKARYDAFKSILKKFEKFKK